MKIRTSVRSIVHPWVLVLHNPHSDPHTITVRAPEVGELQFFVTR